MTKPKLKTAETVIREKAEAEKLKGLQHFKDNIMSGIVFDLDITPELLEILETYETKDL